MTDQTRELCELLERCLAMVDDTSPALMCDLQATLTRLRSSGQDGIRVVPVEPTEEMRVSGGDAIGAYIGIETGNYYQGMNITMYLSGCETAFAIAHKAMLRAGGERAHS